MKARCAAPDALSVLPLLHGLNDPDGPFEVVRDWPSQVAMDLAREQANTRVALISPFDYARHGGPYRIVPGIAVSAPEATGIASLRVRPDARSIHTLAADPRAAADIILATIVIAEKFSASGDDRKKVAIVPSPDPSAVTFDRCDAILEYHPYPSAPGLSEGFVLDLYEEWKDLTGFPHVTGLWVFREEDGQDAWVQSLTDAAGAGVTMRERIARDEALRRGADAPAFVSQIGALSYEFGEAQESSILELYEYAFFHGLVGDIPDLRYFDPSERGE